MYSDIFLFFLNQQIEREISFRTESGLYFSYYKQIVLAPSLSQGKKKIVSDQCFKTKEINSNSDQIRRLN